MLLLLHPRLLLLLLLHHSLRHLHRRAKLSTCPRLHVHRSTVRHHWWWPLLLLRPAVLRLLLAVLGASLRSPRLLLLRIPALRLLLLLERTTILLRLPLLLHVRHCGRQLTSRCECKEERDVAFRSSHSIESSETARQSTFVAE